MNITYSESIPQQSEAYRLLQEATKQLEEILGTAGVEASAQWDVREDGKDRPVYSLNLKDFTGETTGDFAPDELRSPNQVRFRLYLLWLDLLQAANRRRIDKLVSAED